MYSNIEPLVQDVVNGRAGSVISLIAAVGVCGNEMSKSVMMKTLKLQQAGVNEILIHRVTANCECSCATLYIHGRIICVTMI